jgi:hypothetical protein
MDSQAPAQPHEQLLKQLQSVQSEIEAAAGRAKESEVRLKRLEEENGAFQQRVKSLTTELEAERAKSAQAQKEKSVLESRCAQLAKESAAAQSMAESLAKERDEVRDEALAALEESDAESAALKKQIQTVQAEADQAKAQAAKFQQEREAASSRLLALEASANQARAHAEQMARESAEFRKSADHATHEIQALKKQLFEAGQQRDQLQAELKGIEPERDQFRAAAAKAQKESAAAIAAAQAAEATFKKLQEQVGILEKQLRTQEQQAEEQFKRALAEKDTALQARNAELEAARKAATESQSRAQAITRELDSLRVERQKLEHSLSAAQADTDAARQARTDLERKIAELSAKETEARQLAAAQEQARAKLASMEDHLAALQQEKVRLAAALDKVKEDAAGQLAAALQQKGAEFRALENRLATQSSELDSLRRQMETRARQIEAEEEKSRALEVQLARLKAQSKEEDADWQQALETVEQYRTQAEATARRIAELESDLTVKQRELAARVQEAAVFKDQLATLQGTLSMMKSEVLQLRTTPQPNREMDFLLTGITLLAQQARSGTADFRGVLKVLLEESDKRTGDFPSRPPAAAPAASPDAAIVPRAGSVEITPPALIPGGTPVFGTTGHHLRQLEQVDLPGDIALSLDELACAVKDAAWRAKWAAGEKPNPFQGASAAARGKAEEIFHLTARDFCDWLVQPDGVTDPQSFGEKELWSTMYELFAAERLDRMVQRNDFDAANYLSRRLRTFCRRLDALKQRTKGFASWNDLLLPQLRKFPRVVFPVNERRLIIQGTLYGLRSHPETGCEIADWQVEPESDATAPLDSLALAALIFHKAQPEKSFHPVLEHYTQDFAAREVSRADLNRALRERVVPVFYELAGMAQPATLRDPSLDFFPAAHAPEVLHG